MAETTVRFSLFYKARVIKAIVGQSRVIYAFGTTSTGQNPAVPTNTTISATAGSTTLGKLASGNIPFGNLPTKVLDGASVSNSAASAQLQIAAGSVVHYIGIGTVDKLYAYIKLTAADTNYHYEEVGTLTIPAGGYTVTHA